VITQSGYRVGISLLDWGKAILLGQGYFVGGKAILLGQGYFAGSKAIMLGARRFFGCR